MRAEPGTEGYEHPDEARMAAFRRVYERHLDVEDIYPGMAERLGHSGVGRIAEVGGGRGPISAILAPRGVSAVVVDLDEQMLAEATVPPSVATCGPFPSPQGRWTPSSP